MLRVRVLRADKITGEIDFEVVEEDKNVDRRDSRN